MGRSFGMIARGIHFISRSVTWISVIAIASIMVLIGVHVIGRYFFKTPVKGMIEIAAIFMVFIVFFAVAEVTREKSHVNVDILLIRLSKRTQNIFLLITSFLCIVISVIIAWKMWSRALYLWSNPGETSGATLGIPLMPFIIVAALGFTLLSLELLVDIIERTFQSMKARKELKEVGYES
jgi:C4-dicarboxylate transporter, DctQ subunit